ncbi:MAG: hypothetical protein HY360_23125 [Verrucomicrobia bacterium]|nr:hypothetical protein [Verrucomicrobiota bacterium]
MNPPPHQTAETIDLPLRYFVFGLIALAIFGAALPLFAADALAQHHYTHRAVALTHLLTLGWITSVILGATIQLVPVALGVKLHSPRLARRVFWFHAIGVIGMVAGFWFWNFKTLLWFATLVSVGLALFIYNLLRTLRRVPRQDAVSVHIATSLIYLALTFLAGQYLMHDKLIVFSPFSVLSAIHAHAHLAAMGWFTLLIMGVSYRLIPMFTLSDIQSPRRVWTAYALLNIGILSVFTGILLRQNWLPLAASVAGLGLMLWFWEINAIFRKRKRAQLDGALQQARIALFHLPAIFVLGLWQSWPDGHPSLLKMQAQTGYGLLMLLGFVTFFMMGMLYKVIPFLVWYKIYPPLVGRQPVPKLQDLYSAALERWGAAIFIGGLWATSISASLAPAVSFRVIQTCAALMGIGIWLVVINLWFPMSRLILQHGCPLARCLLYWEKQKSKHAVRAPLSIVHAGGPK